MNPPEPPGLTMASSSSSSSFQRIIQRDKNRYGSLDDLQAYALQTRNHTLTVKLVEAKRDWETLQSSYRANTHARFLYQTTLARIVNHVQDFSDQDDPAQLQLLCDLLKWTKECEHIVSQIGDTNLSSTASEDSSSQEMLRSATTNSGLTGSNRTPIIDYNDVQIFVDTSTIPFAWTMNHESLQEQNDNLQKEIQKWQSSMARIRICNRREASELYMHQTTLRRVVERITQSDFSNKQQVVEWYEACQREAEKCGSFSEQDAAKLCHRCNSRLEDESGSDDNVDVSGVYIEEAKTPFPPPKSPKKTPLRVEMRMDDCPDTPTTVATRNDETAKNLGTREESIVTSAIQLAHDEEHQHKNAAGMEIEHEVKQAISVAAANVEDPPDRIQAKATNLNESSIVQDKHAGCAAAICCIM